MKNIIANMMSGVLEFVLWLNIVVCAIVGYKMGNEMNSHYFIGLILGVLVGFLVNVFEGGFFLLLMEIRNDVKEIAVTNSIIRDYVKKIAEKNETATKNEIATKNEASDTKKVNIDMNSLLR